MLMPLARRVNLQRSQGPMEEVETKKSRRVEIDNFRGDSSPEDRIAWVKDFVTKIETMGNYGEYEVKAYNKGGRDAFIIFKDGRTARQFHSDNKKAFKDALVKYPEGERKLFFNQPTTVQEGKVQTGTRLLAKKLKEFEAFKTQDVVAQKFSGIVSSNKFAVAYVKCNDDLQMKFVVDQRNLKDMGLGAHIAELDAMVQDFAKDFY